MVGAGVRSSLGVWWGLPRVQERPRSGLCVSAAPACPDPGLQPPMSSLKPVSSQVRALSPSLRFQELKGPRGGISATGVRLGRDFLCPVASDGFSPQHHPSPSLSLLCFWNLLPTRVLDAMKTNVYAVLYSCPVAPLKSPWGQEYILRGRVSSWHAWDLHHIPQTNKIKQKCKSNIVFCYVFWIPSEIPVLPLFGSLGHSLSLRIKSKREMNLGLSVTKNSDLLRPTVQTFLSQPWSRS